MWLAALISATACSRVESSQSKDRRRYSSSNKPKRQLTRLLKALPRIVFVVFFGRFVWDLYLLHSTPWGDDLFLPLTGGNDHRFLEHFAEGLTTHVLSIKQSKTPNRIKRPPQNISFSTATSIVKLKMKKKTLPSSVSGAKFQWEQLCARAGLNQSSRVLVTDVIRQSAATLTAFIISYHCNVRSVIGTDLLFPNLRVSRLRYMQIYKKLYQMNPNFRLVVTTQGLRRSTEESVPTWLLDFNPTHVLVSDHVPDDQYVASMMDQDKYQLYMEKHYAHVWGDVFSLLKKKSQNHPRVVHLATTASSSLCDGPRKAAKANIPLLYVGNLRRNITRVALPSLYGPGTSFVTTADDPFEQVARSPFEAGAFPYIHVGDGLKAILSAFSTEEVDGYVDLQVDDSVLLQKDQVEKMPLDLEKQPSRVRQAIAWNEYLRNPYGESELKSPSAVKMSTEPLSSRDGILPRNRLPCASQCTSKYVECQPSVFDEVVGVSQQATSECEFVVYIGDFSVSLDALPPPQDLKPRTLCRLAFVSKNSKIVQTRWRKAQANNKNVSLSALNGKLEHNSWVLLWPSLEYEDFSIADASILRIDPSRFFSPKVSKALYIGNTVLSKLSNQRALRLLNAADTKGYQTGERGYHDHRTGTHLSRWVELAPVKPRHAALFGSSAFPASMTAINPDEIVRGKSHSKEQVQFYKQLNHRVNTNEGRPEFETRGTVYRTFPYQWIGSYFLVHSMKVEESRLLRCEWFEEHVSWGKMNQAKGSMEELSLGYVLGRRKTMGLIGPPDVHSEIEGSMPMLTPNGEQMVDSRGGEVYIVLLEPQRA